MKLLLIDHRGISSFLLSILLSGVLASAVSANNQVEILPPAYSFERDSTFATMEWKTDLPKMEQREYAGVVYPLHGISLSMGVDGLVSSIAVKLGDVVEKGALILQLDDASEEIEANRRRVILDNVAELRSLDERVQRTQALLDDTRLLYQQSGSVSREEVVRAELEFFSLQGRYEQLKMDKAREELEYQAAVQQKDMRRLIAPISGHITQLEIDEGEWVAPGQILMELMDTSSGVLRLAIPQSIARQVILDMEVGIRFDAYPNISDINGRVTFVSVAADPASGLVKMEITFDNREIQIRLGGKGYALLPSPGKLN